MTQIVPLVISIVAIVLSIKAYRRSGRQERHSAKTEALDLALSVEMMLKSVYSNVLTLDPGRYRKEVSEVINRLRSNLPGMISTVQSYREKMQTVNDVASLNSIAVSLRSAAAEVRNLVEAFLRGLERGKAA